MIGPVAAGKTTLGRALALELPWIELDDERHRGPPGPLPDDAWAARHAELVSRPAWVMSGDHRAVAPARFARAEVVVWLDPPRWWWARRALRRGPGAVTRREVLRWIRRYRRHGRAETERALAGHPHVLRVTGARNVTVGAVLAALAERAQ